MKLFKTTRPVGDILKHLPIHPISNYHQPIIGDGSALFTVLSKLQITGSIYVSDSNYRIVKLFRDIQSNYDEFVKGADIIYNEYMQCDLDIGRPVASDINEAKQSTGSYYYWMKQTYSNMCKEGHDSTLMSVLYLFLNNTNPKVKSKFYNKADLAAMSVLIQPVVFQYQVVKTSLLNVNLGKNDYVYFDLPIDIEASVFKLCKELICDYLICSSETSKILAEFPLGLYGFQRIATGSDNLSTLYTVIIHNLNLEMNCQ
jgi:hypothetical protein